MPVTGWTESLGDSDTRRVSSHPPKVAVVAADSVSSATVCRLLSNHGLAVADVTEIVRRQPEAEEARRLVMSELTLSGLTAASRTPVTASDARTTTTRLSGVAFVAVVGSRTWQEEERLEATASGLFGEAFERRAAILVSQADASMTLRRLDSRGLSGRYALLDDVIGDTDRLLRLLRAAANLAEGACGVEGDASVPLVSEEASEVSDSSKELSRTEGSPLACYDMTGSPVGHCLIVNNSKYADVEEFPERLGSERDVERLEKTFEALQFTVIVKRNLKASELTELLLDYSKMNHVSMRCLVCVIMAHGTNGAVIGVDGGRVYLQMVLSFFYTSNCPGLANKPKIFFVQACRGRRESRVETDGHESDKRRHFCPDQMHFLLSFSTVPEYVSYRITDSGTVYVQRLCDVLEERWSGEDLVSLLGEVTRRVGMETIRHQGDTCCQVASLESTLAARVFFGASESPVHRRHREILKEQETLAEAMRNRNVTCQQLKATLRDRDEEIERLHDVIAKCHSSLTELKNAEMTFWQQQEEQMTTRVKESAERFELVDSLLTPALQSESSPSRQILLLLGAEGSGRSSLGNALIGRCEFPINETICSCCWGVGEQLTVIDTPAANELMQTAKFLRDELAKCKYFDAVLLVYRLRAPIDKREVPEDVVSQLQTFSLCRKIFGSEFYNSVVLVFTHSDCIQSDEEKFREVIRSLRDNFHILNDLMQQLDDRYVMIDSRGQCHQQVQRLLQATANARRMKTDEIQQRLSELCKFHSFRGYEAGHK